MNKLEFKMVQFGFFRRLSDELIAIFHQATLTTLRRGSRRAHNIELFYN